MKSVSFVGLCLVFLADSLPEAHAKHRQIVNGDHFRDVDVDNSRHITMQEVKIYMENKFEAEMDAWVDFYDPDRDGIVGKESYLKMAKSSEKYWDTVDTDGDGSTNIVEATAGRLAARPLQERTKFFFDHYDDDGDGHIHREEFKANVAELARDGHAHPAGPHRENADYARHNRLWRANARVDSAEL